MTSTRSALSPQTEEPCAVGGCSSTAPGSALLLALLKHEHLTDDTLRQRIEQRGSQAAGMGQIHSRDRQGGRRRRTPTPISVPLPHVTTVQHSEAETTQVYLLPVMQVAQPSKSHVGGWLNLQSNRPLHLHHQEGLQTLRKSRHPSISNGQFGNSILRPTLHDEMDA